MTKIFISWGGEQSQAIAQELRAWIPSVLQFAKPYFTAKDIDKGAKWNSEISTELSECSVGIICLTPEAIVRPWVIFEAGALSKGRPNSRVCPLLFGINDAAFDGPLRTFQTTKFEKEDFKKLMTTINDVDESLSLSKEFFDGAFETYWPRLETSISIILHNKNYEREEKTRHDREVIDEILQLTRSIRRSMPESGDVSTIYPGFVFDFVSQVKQLVQASAVARNRDLHASVDVLLGMAKQFVEKFQNSDPDLLQSLEYARDSHSGYDQF